ncbi:MAG: hypothetical protein ACREJN_18140 [Nitrospiraceae bacterium]
MKVICTKAQAATRQLDEAIVLLFADHDPLAIRTLAAAAHGILADLVEHKLPGRSWRTKVIEDSGLSKKEALVVLNNAQNYLKHADRDPGAELSFDEEENDHVIFVATLECAELGHPLSFGMQAFQIWYLASYPEKIGAETEPVLKSRSAFPDLNKLAREARLTHGAEFMKSLRPKYEGKLLSNPSFKRTTNGAV